MNNITYASHRAGLSVPSYARRYFGKQSAKELFKMRKYPKTLSVAKKMALAAGVPLGMILAQVNFTSLRLAEQWSNLSLFAKIAQRILAVFGNARYFPK